MREIKFRSWNPDNKKMYYDFDQNIQELTVGQNIHNYVYSIGLFHGTLMQFTGLKDKNGVEIYEGDIVALSDKPFSDIKYYDGAFRMNSDIILNTLRSLRLKIIGNIHQNPELL